MDDSSFTGSEPDVNDQRWKAVNNPETAMHILEVIITDGCRGLVRRAAEHPSVSQELLLTLSQHEDPEIRAAVVHNHKTTNELHWQLAKDESPDVRYAVAESYLVNTDVLSSLLEDVNPYISHRARATLKKRNVQMVVAADFPETSSSAFTESDRTSSL